MTHDYDLRIVAHHEAAHAVLAKKFSGCAAFALVWKNDQAREDMRNFSGKAIFDLSGMTAEQLSIVALSGVCGEIISATEHDIDELSLALELEEIIESNWLSSTDAELAGNTPRDHIATTARAVMQNLSEIKHVSDELMSRAMRDGCGSVSA